MAQQASNRDREVPHLVPGSRSTGHGVEDWTPASKRCRGRPRLRTQTCLPTTINSHMSTARAASNTTSRSGCRKLKLKELLPARSSTSPRRRLLEEDCTLRLKKIKTPKTARPGGALQGCATLGGDTGTPSRTTLLTPSPSPALWHRDNAGLEQSREAPCHSTGKRTFFLRPRRSKVTTCDSPASKKRQHSMTICHKEGGASLACSRSRSTSTCSKSCHSNPSGPRISTSQTEVIHAVSQCLTIDTTAKSRKNREFSTAMASTSSDRLSLAAASYKSIETPLTKSLSNLCLQEEAVCPAGEDSTTFRARDPRDALSPICFPVPCHHTSSPSIIRSVPTRPMKFQSLISLSQPVCNFERFLLDENPSNAFVASNSPQDLQQWKLPQHSEAILHVTPCENSAMLNKSFSSINISAPPVAPVQARGENSACLSSSGNHKTDKVQPLESGPPTPAVPQQSSAQPPKSSNSMVTETPKQVSLTEGVTMCAASCRQPTTPFVPSSNTTQIELFKTMTQREPSKSTSLQAEPSKVIRAEIQSSQNATLKPVSPYNSIMQTEPYHDSKARNKASLNTIRQSGRSLCRRRRNKSSHARIKQIGPSQDDKTSSESSHNNTMQSGPLQDQKLNTGSSQGKTKESRIFMDCKTVSGPCLNNTRQKEPISNTAHYGSFTDSTRQDEAFKNTTAQGSSRNTKTQAKALMNTVTPPGPSQNTQAQVEASANSTTQAVPSNSKRARAGPSRVNTTQKRPSKNNGVQAGPLNSKIASAGPSRVNTTQKRPSKNNEVQAGPLNSKIASAGPSRVNTTQKRPSKNNAAQAGSCNKELRQSESCMNITQAELSTNNLTHAGSCNTEIRKSVSCMNVTQAELSTNYLTHAGSCNKEVTKIGSCMKGSQAEPSPNNMTQTTPSNTKITKDAPFKDSVMQDGPSQKNTLQSGPSLDKVTEHEPSKKCIIHFEPSQSMTRDRASMDMMQHKPSQDSIIQHRPQSNVTTVEPSRNTKAGPSVNIMKDVEWPKESKVQFEPSSDNTPHDKPSRNRVTQSGPSRNNKTREDPFKKARIQARPSTKNMEQAERLEKDVTPSEPVANTAACAGPSEKNVTQPGSSRSSMTQPEPTSDNATHARASSKSITQTRPSTSNATQVRPSTSNATQIRPSTSNRTQARPSTSNSTQTKPSTNNATQARPSMDANEVQVRPSRNSIMQTGPLGSTTQVEPSMVNVTHPNRPSHSHSAQTRPDKNSGLPSGFSKTQTTISGPSKSIVTTEGLSKNQTTPATPHTNCLTQNTTSKNQTTPARPHTNQTTQDKTSAEQVTPARPLKSIMTPSQNHGPSKYSGMPTGAPKIKVRRVEPSKNHTTPPRPSFIHSTPNGPSKSHMLQVTSTQSRTAQKNSTANPKILREPSRQLMTPARPSTHFLTPVRKPEMVALCRSPELTTSPRLSGVLETPSRPSKVFMTPVKSSVKAITPVTTSGSASTQVMPLLMPVTPLGHPVNSPPLSQPLLKPATLMRYPAQSTTHHTIQSKTTPTIIGVQMFTKDLKTGISGKLGHISNTTRSADAPVLHYVPPEDKRNPNVEGDSQRNPTQPVFMKPSSTPATAPSSASPVMEEAALQRPSFEIISPTPTTDTVKLSPAQTLPLAASYMTKIHVDALKLLQGYKKRPPACPSAKRTLDNQLDPSLSDATFDNCCKVLPVKGDEEARKILFMTPLVHGESRVNQAGGQTRQAKTPSLPEKNRQEVVLEGDYTSTVHHQQCVSDQDSILRTGSLLATHQSSLRKDKDSALREQGPVTSKAKQETEDSSKQSNTAAASNDSTITQEATVSLRRVRVAVKRIPFLDRLDSGMSDAGRSYSSMPCSTNKAERGGCRWHPEREVLKQVLEPVHPRQCSTKKTTSCSCEVRKFNLEGKENIPPTKSQAAHVEEEAKVKASMKTSMAESQPAVKGENTPVQSRVATPEPQKDTKVMTDAGECHRGVPLSPTVLVVRVNNRVIKSAARKWEELKVQQRANERNRASKADDKVKRKRERADTKKPKLKTDSVSHKKNKPRPTPTPTPSCTPASTAAHSNPATRQSKGSSSPEDEKKELPSDDYGIFTSQRLESPNPLITSSNLQLSVKQKVARTGVVDTLLRKLQLDQNRTDCTPSASGGMQLATPPPSQELQSIEHQAPEVILNFLPRLSQALKTKTMSQSHLKLLTQPKRPLPKNPPPFTPAKRQRKCQLENGYGRANDEGHTVARGIEGTIVKRKSPSKPCRLIPQEKAELEDFDLRGNTQCSANLKKAKDNKAKGMNMMAEEKVPREEKTSLSLEKEANSRYDDTQDFKPSGEEQMTRRMRPRKAKKSTEKDFKSDQQMPKEEKSSSNLQSIAKGQSDSILHHPKPTSEKKTSKRRRLEKDRECSAGEGEVKRKLPQKADQESSGNGEVKQKLPQMKDQESSGEGEVKQKLPQKKDQESSREGKVKQKLPQRKDQESSEEGELQQLPQKDQESSRKGELQQLPQKKDQESSEEGELQQLPQKKDQESSEEGELQQLPQNKDQESSGEGEVKQKLPQRKDQESSDKGDLQQKQPQRRDQESSGRCISKQKLPQKGKSHLTVQKITEGGGEGTQDHPTDAAKGKRKRGRPKTQAKLKEEETKTQTENKQIQAKREEEDPKAQTGNKRPKRKATRSEPDRPNSKKSLDPKQTHTNAMQMLSDSSHIPPDPTHKQIRPSHTHTGLPHSHTDLPQHHTDLPHSHTDLPHTHTDPTQSRTNQSHTQTHPTYTNININLAHTHINLPHSHTNTNLPHTHINPTYPHTDPPHSYTNPTYTNTSHTQTRPAEVPQIHTHAQANSTHTNRTHTDTNPVHTYTNTSSTQSHPADIPQMLHTQPQASFTHTHPTHMHREPSHMPTKPTHASPKNTHIESNHIYTPKLVLSQTHGSPERPLSNLTQSYRTDPPPLYTHSQPHMTYILQNHTHTHSSLSTHLHSAHTQPQTDASDSRHSVAYAYFNSVNACIETTHVPTSPSLSQSFYTQPPTPSLTQRKIFKYKHQSYRLHKARLLRGHP